MFFTQKLSFKFRPGLTKEGVDLHEIEHYRSNVNVKYHSLYKLQHLFCIFKLLVCLIIINTTVADLCIHFRID